MNVSETNEARNVGYFYCSCIMHKQQRVENWDLTGDMFCIYILTARGELHGSRYQIE